MMLKGGMSCRIRNMSKIASVGVWEELTWVIQWVDHNIGVGARNLFVGILGTGQKVRERGWKNHSQYS
jgi:hypothetical protein